MKIQLTPRIQALIMFAVVVLAAALAAFVKSMVSGEAFSLNWGVTLVAAAACAVVFYLGPPLIHRLTHRDSK